MKPFLNSEHYLCKNRLYFTLKLYNYIWFKVWTKSDWERGWAECGNLHKFITFYEWNKSWCSAEYSYKIMVLQPCFLLEIKYFQFLGFLYFNKCSIYQLWGKFWLDTWLENLMVYIKRTTRKWENNSSLTSIWNVAWFCILPYVI